MYARLDFIYDIYEELEYMREKARQRLLLQALRLSVQGEQKQMMLSVIFQSMFSKKNRIKFIVSS